MLLSRESQAHAHEATHWCHSLQETQNAQKDPRPHAEDWASGQPCPSQPQSSSPSRDSVFLSIQWGGTLPLSTSQLVGRLPEGMISLDIALVKLDLNILRIILPEIRSFISRGREPFSRQGPFGYHAIILSPHKIINLKTSLLHLVGHLINSPLLP